ncbi:MAG: tetratricopeptide repeat protein [Planctomycetes bacterium]|nr:tetratricopeptide repeat protein [Planctomycetota bacterium]
MTRQPDPARTGWLRAASAIGCALWLATAAPAQEPTGDDLFQQGRDALFLGNYPSAIDLLQKAVRTDADGTKTAWRLYLAKAYRYAGQDTEAEPLLRHILTVSPDHVEAGQALAEIFAGRKEWQAILTVLEPLLKYRHDYPTYHLLAEAAYNLDKTPQARRYYQQAVALNPKSPVDHYQLGNLYLQENSFALAADAYGSALALGLDSPVLHYKLASAYFNLRNYFGHIEQTEVKAGKAGTIHRDRFLIEPVPGRADTFLTAPVASAIWQVAKAIDGGLDDRPDIHVLRANIYLNAQRFDQAHALFVAIEPKVPEADQALFYFYFAQAAFGLGAFDDYLRLLGEAIRRDPAAYRASLVVAYQKVADHYNQTGKLDEYIDYLGRAVAESPRTAALHLKLGNAFQEVRKYAQAVVQWRMVLDLEPDHPQRTELLNLIERWSGA